MREREEEEKREREERASSVKLIEPTAAAPSQPAALMLVAQTTRPVHIFCIYHVYKGCERERKNDEERCKKPKLKKDCLLEIS